MSRNQTFCLESSVIPLPCTLIVQINQLQTHSYQEIKKDTDYIGFRVLR